MHEHAARGIPGTRIRPAKSGMGSAEKNREPCVKTRAMKLALLALTSVATVWSAGPILTPEQVQSAILHGSMYRTADQFLERGLKGRRTKVAGAMAMDGISKYATFFNDWGAVSVASAAASQQMRKVNRDDLQINGLLHAFVEIHARGANGVGKLDRRYGTDVPILFCSLLMAVSFSQSTGVCFTGLGSRLPCSCSAQSPAELPWTLRLMFCPPIFLSR